ncbi:synaptonemal complex protein 2-like isoform X2 [Betta splendens]|uniref:Synaptonemal complex protein 2-like isoform X2 n=1 Tax=Betta splendens TaxID=158456 RepID=A0A9W2XPW6_BETSP|nr:synaptonemal complex protein 2-like isoform X2 [Betta splendens]
MFAVKIDDCLLRGDSSHLVSVIQYEGLTSTTLSTLDTLVTKDLCGSGFSRVLVVLKSLRILSENKDDLQTLIDNGLTAKVLLWFDAVLDLLTSDLHRSSAPLLSLMEEFCDYFLVLGQASLPASQLSVVLLHLARVALDTRIHFPLRLEAVRTFNSVLEPLSRDQRKVIQNDQNQILSQVAAAVLTVGDYELQVSLSEALCRLTPRKDREQRASQWFSNRDISRAFCEIRDGDFEVDCRRFLNFINCYHGDQRRVYTFPCLTAFLESTQLFQPKDEKLDDFWIDFNVGSGCISFFIDEPQAFLWGSIHLLRDEVDHYSLQLKEDEVVLSVSLTNPIMHHNSRGQTVKLSFSCEHQKELGEATERVFMKAQSSPQVKDPVGPVQASPSVAKHGDRSYSRKKQQSKSVLKILPLSSPSSEDESSAPKAAGRNRAEVLFDQIVHSTPSYRSGVHVRAALDSPDPTDPFGQSGSDLKQFPVCFQDVSSSSRKRSAQDSGYLSDPNVSTQKPKMEPRSEGEDSAQTGCPVVVEEEDGFCTEEAGLSAEHPVTEPEAPPQLDLTSGITAAFRRFKDQLEKHFADCWTKVESEVLLSLNECHQHVASLLTAVHQHRSLMLLKFENGITDQLEQLDRTSTNLNCINSQILSFFQSEMKQLGSFCDEHLQRLKSLENEDDSVTQ